MSNQDQTFNLDFQGAKDYTPYEGSGLGGLLPWQGMTFGRIVEIEKGESENKNKTLALTVEFTEKGAEGVKLQRVQAVTGIRKDQKPNILGLYDILTSVYSGTEPNEEAALAKVRALEGQSMNVDHIISLLMNQVVYVTVEAKKFTRKDGSAGWGSDIKNFIKKSRFEAAEKSNTHHRPNPPESAGGTATVTAPAPGSVAASGRSVL